MFRRTAATHLRTANVRLPEPIVQLICTYFDVRSALIESKAMRCWAATRRSATEAMNNNTNNEKDCHTVSREQMSSDLKAYSCNRFFQIALWQSQHGDENDFLRAACLHDLQHSEESAYFLIKRTAPGAYMRQILRWPGIFAPPTDKLIDSFAVCVHNARREVDTLGQTRELYVLRRTSLSNPTSPELGGQQQLKLSLVWLGSTKQQRLAFSAALDKWHKTMLQWPSAQYDLEQEASSDATVRLPGSCKIVPCGFCAKARIEVARRLRLTSNAPAVVRKISCAECQDFGLQVDYTCYLPCFVSLSRDKLERVKVDDVAHAVYACFGM